MAFKIGANTAYTNDGTPFLWGSGDQTTTPSNQVKIVSSDLATGDNFGFAVGVGCSRIVVGAHLDDDTASNSGSAYIFNIAGTQLAKIVASDPEASDFFGRAVAVGCGRIVIGAGGDDDNGSLSGSAYIFNLNGTQIAKIKPSDGAAGDLFGRAVAVGSGRIVIGAQQDDDGATDTGSAYIFNLSGSQLAKIKASDAQNSDFFGRSVAVGNGRIVVGAFGDDDLGDTAGAAYIFDLSGTQIAKIKASDGYDFDYFGISVAVGCGRIVVGAYLQGFISAPFFAPRGAVYIFDLNGTQLAKITGSDTIDDGYFGYSVAIGSGRIVVGSYQDDDNGFNSGSTYVFDLDGKELAKIKASDGAAGDLFGQAVGVESGRIVVGAYNNAEPGSGSGSAYIYTTPMVYTPYDVADLNSYGQ